MRKTISFFILIVLIVISLSACSFSEENKQPANGIVMIGDEQYTLPIFERYKENIKEKEVFEVKTGAVDENKVLIIDKSTAQAMIKAKILRTNDVNNRSDSISIKKLPDIPKGSSLIFTHKDENHITSIDLNSKEIPVSYDSDAWIGNSRDYKSQWYLIVAENDVYKEIKANETKLQLIRFKKSLGYEKPKMSTDNTIVIEYLKLKRQVKDFHKLISVKFITFEDES
ncbi:lipoprotein BA_5634 family protein [Paenibacillus sp. 102]|uniref:lipoprotein BA_5634 family protein n=1 Tax=Paenibacillus sp. 102 TaxID=3120823 RepID=UPI0031BB69BF